MPLFSSLTRPQKEAVGILQIGTMLEYFDLMLYVHMAVLLNELFFPKTDPFTASLVAAFSFCTSYVFRPFGALLFGYIGDNLGRKTTVIITTGLMAFSCICMAILPTYAQIGITAAWLLTICRAIQGISSMGELVGAEIYLTEITKPPVRYPVVAWVRVSSILGKTLALGVATFIMAFGFDWRYAFLLGASIAVLGSAARTRLQETPDFLEAKRRKKKNKPQDEKIDQKTMLALFITFMAWPVYFYFSFVYCGEILKNNFRFSIGEIIQQSLYVSLAELIASCLLAHLSYRIYPLTIVKFKLMVCFLFILACPFLLSYVETPFQLLLIQSAAIAFSLNHEPAGAIFYAHFPVLKRFTSISLIYAIARALMHVVSSFGLVYLTAWMGPWGLWVIMIPGAIGFTWAILHFEKIDKPERKAFEAPSAKAA